MTTPTPLLRTSLPTIPERAHTAPPRPTHTPAGECEEYEAWRFRARTSRVLDTLCLLFKTTLIILGAAIFINALIYVPGITDIPTRLHWLESSAGVLLGLHLMVTAALHLSRVPEKCGAAKHDLYYWAVIVDIFTLGLGTVFAVGIAARYFLAPSTQSLFAMYLSASFLALVNLAFDFAQVRLAKTYAFM